MKSREYSDYYLFYYCGECFIHCLDGVEIFSAKERRAAHWSGLWVDTEDMGE
jgi:hypothetical protein